MLMELHHLQACRRTSRALVAREVEAPWIPNIKDEVDTSNFDADDDEDPEEPYEDDGSHWDDGF